MYCDIGRNVYTEPLSHAMRNDRSELFTSNSSNCIFLFGTNPSEDYHELPYEEYIEVKLFQPISWLILTDDYTIGFDND